MDRCTGDCKKTEIDGSFLDPVETFLEGMVFYLLLLLKGDLLIKVRKQPVLDSINLLKQ
jgi:hypothetical protein